MMSAREENDSNDNKSCSFSDITAKVMSNSCHRAVDEGSSPHHQSEERFAFLCAKNGSSAASAGRADSLASLVTVVPASKETVNILSSSSSSVEDANNNNDTDCGIVHRCVAKSSSSSNSSEQVEVLPPEQQEQQPCMSDSVESSSSSAKEVNSMSLEAARRDTTSTLGRRPSELDLLNSSSSEFFSTLNNLHTDTTDSSIISHSDSRAAVNQPDNNDLSREATSSSMIKKYVARPSASSCVDEWKSSPCDSRNHLKDVVATLVNKAQVAKATTTTSASPAWMQSVTSANDTQFSNNSGRWMTTTTSSTTTTQGMPWNESPPAASKNEEQQYNGNSNSPMEQQQPPHGSLNPSFRSNPPSSSMMMRFNSDPLLPFNVRWHQPKTTPIVKPTQQQPTSQPLNPNNASPLGAPIISPGLVSAVFLDQIKSLDMIKMTLIRLHNLIVPQLRGNPPSQQPDNNKIVLRSDAGGEPSPPSASSNYDNNSTSAPMFTYTRPQYDKRVGQSQNASSPQELHPHSGPATLPFASLTSPRAPQHNNAIIEMLQEHQLGGTATTDSNNKSSSTQSTQRSSIESILSRRDVSSSGKINSSNESHSIASLGLATALDHLNSLILKGAHASEASASVLQNLPAIRRHQHLLPQGLLQNNAGVLINSASQVHSQECTLPGGDWCGDIRCPHIPSLNNEFNMRPPHNRPPFGGSHPPGNPSELPFGSLNTSSNVHNNNAPGAWNLIQSSALRHPGSSETNTPPRCLIMDPSSALLNYKSTNQPQRQSAPGGSANPTKLESSGGGGPSPVAIIHSNGLLSPQATSAIYRSQISATSFHTDSTARKLLKHELLLRTKLLGADDYVHIEWLPCVEAEGIPLAWRSCPTQTQISSGEEPPSKSQNSSSHPDHHPRSSVSLSEVLASLSSLESLFPNDPSDTKTDDTEHQQCSTHKTGGMAWWLSEPVIGGWRADVFRVVCTKTEGSTPVESLKEADRNLPYDSCITFASSSQRPTMEIRQNQIHLCQNPTNHALILTRVIVLRDRTELSIKHGLIALFDWVEHCIDTLRLPTTLSCGAALSNDQTAPGPTAASAASVPSNANHKRTRNNSRTLRPRVHQSDSVGDTAAGSISSDPHCIDPDTDGANWDGDFKKLRLYALPHDYGRSEKFDKRGSMRFIQLSLPAGHTLNPFAEWLLRSLRNHSRCLDEQQQRQSIDQKSMYSGKLTPAGQIDGNGGQDHHQNVSTSHHAWNVALKNFHSWVGVVFGNGMWKAEVVVDATASRRNSFQKSLRQVNYQRAQVEILRWLMNKCYEYRIPYFRLKGRKSEYVIAVRPIFDVAFHGSLLAQLGTQPRQLSQVSVTKSPNSDASNDISTKTNEDQLLGVKDEQREEDAQSGTGSAEDEDCAIPSSPGNTDEMPDEEMRESRRKKFRSSGNGRSSHNNILKETHEVGESYNPKRDIRVTKGDKYLRPRRR